MVARINIRTEHSAIGAPAGIFSQKEMARPRHPEAMPKIVEIKNIFFRSYVIWYAAAAGLTMRAKTRSPPTAFIDAVIAAPQRNKIP